MLTHLPSIITTSITSSTDAIHKHKPVLSRQDLPTLLLTLTLVQVTHLNSQISHYENCQDNCIDPTQESSKSLSEKEPLEVTDYGISSLTTTNPLDYTKETTKWYSSITVYWNYSNPTDLNLPTSPQEAFDVDHHYDNTLWKNALAIEYDRLLCRSIHIDINDSSIIPIFKIKHSGRHKIWLCYPVN